MLVLLKFHCLLKQNRFPFTCAALHRKLLDLTTYYLPLYFQETQHLFPFVKSQELKVE